MQGYPCLMHHVEILRVKKKTVRSEKLGGGGALCVEMGFTWTFPRNQDATVKLKSELISIKF